MKPKRGRRHAAEANARVAPRRRIFAKPLTCAIAVASSLSAAALCVVPTPAAAQVATQGVQYAISAGSLHSALTALAQQGRLQLVYEPSLVAGKSTEGLHGYYTPAAAMTSLLRGTAISWKAINADTFILERATPADPPRPQTTSADADPATKIESKTKPATLQTVVVTGSHIPRSVLETDNPVVSISGPAIVNSGSLTLGDLMQKLPSITGGFLTGADNNSPNNNAGGGSTLVGLRGLGASRTLVLVNGQRVIKTWNGAVDFNSIPVQAIQRIDVMTSGASAIYGSAAIGGVINVILKDHYNGAQVSINDGISSHGDGQQRGGSFMFGSSDGKKNFLFGASYEKIDAIQASARKFARESLTTAGTENGHPVYVKGGSSLAPTGFISIPAGLATQFGCPTSAGNGIITLQPGVFAAGTSPVTSSDFKCFEQSDRFGFNEGGQLTTEQTRANLFFNGDYHVTDNVDLYATYYHYRNRSNAVASAPEISSLEVPGTLISAQSYYNPFGISFGPNGGVYQVRSIPTGLRTNRLTNTTNELMVGAKGDFNAFDRDWNWNVGFNYGHITTVLTLLEYADSSKLSPGLGPSFLNSAGVVQCGTPSDPVDLASCTPWDPFNVNSPESVKVLEAATSPGVDNMVNIERQYHAGINGIIFALPAGDVSIAAGVSRRDEVSSQTADGTLGLTAASPFCDLMNECFADVSGQYHVTDVFGEMLVPILKDMPFAHGLNVTLADRYSHYSDFGSTNNWKIGVEWRPIRDLLVRGTVSKVFRAPTVADVFATESSANPGLSRDPCDGITTANPACVGVPLDGSFKNFFDNHQLVGLQAGSQAAGFPIGPERGKSFDFGIVYSPRFIPGLSGTFDVWRIYLNDTITNINAQSVLDGCFNGAEEFCPLITRFTTGANAGQIQTIIDPTGNLGRIDVKGDDLDLRYQLPATPIGEFAVDLNSTYMNQFKIQTDPGEPDNDVVNGAGLMGWLGSTLQAVCPFNISGMCLFPRWQARVTVDWRLGAWSAEWGLNALDGFSMAGAHEAGGPQVVGLDKYGSYVYNNFSVAYEIPKVSTEVQVGVNNAFNKQPPLLGGNRSINSNTDPDTFDVIGRYYWARLTYRF